MNISPLLVLSILTILKDFQSVLFCMGDLHQNNIFTFANVCLLGTPYNIAIMCST